ncbi:hypothetical protein L226DRAFT_538715 [Lentinus tigrinus ALCF2SS1-7]|uniref:PQ loop repeat protein n=1 Tax=Lentinus tigrinus ALCF2SS1-6 TaxID=1328759 RepID=A0A5C2RUW2_9APHY|nr:hypothetical protein L227DRAFT_579678 [Lentinus tigrinus ALCF2SS1-6]RPD70670.1 hypothetical protein L226DRAFT_538715 [Lentinus tigrinus ALCF2SS1-7]
MSVCEPHHDAAANALTAFMCVGITVSYLPQHWRIISAKSSEGFSPWFLLLGGMSSASGMLNIIVMQWGIIKCCRVLSFGSCIESIAGIFQLALVWVLFVMILVLYMIYYPPELKYVEVDVDLPNEPPQHIKTPVKREQWKLSITLSWVIFWHIAFLIFITFMLLSTNPAPDWDYRSPQLELWATFLGVSSALLAMFQYTPQIAHTWRIKHVGALSIPMMCIQTPGAILMVLSIALRPGTNWTTWISYAIAGAMQGILLVMCIIFRARQHALGLDDFGQPINPAMSHATSSDAAPPTTPAVEAAVGDAVQSDMRSEHGVDVSAGEDTPLLTGKQHDAGSKGRGLFGWLKR